VAEHLGGELVVKALVPAGRRGKAGGVITTASPQACAESAGDLIGRTIADYPVSKVYVESRIDIAEELYLGFFAGGERPHLLLSRFGGVDIESTFNDSPDDVIKSELYPCRELTEWEARELWLQAGVQGPLLRELGELTARLAAAFRNGDMVLLEINPLATDAEGRLNLVGAMMEVDTQALDRQPEWKLLKDPGAGASANERELQVDEINRAVPGGECRYIELDGDIGLLVGGGGAGLYQHDLIVNAGGRPANHCVTPPTGSDSRKLKAVIRAILGNPKTRSLLVGFNFAQMARADIRVRSLVEVIDEMELDAANFPIVIRMFGAGEAEARALVDGRPGFHYMARGTTLSEAVRRIVTLTNEIRERTAS
jgi:succinyl-CoA synthetase beta subunit